MNAASIGISTLFARLMPEEECDRPQEGQTGRRLGKLCRHDDGRDMVSFFLCCRDIIIHEKDTTVDHLSFFTTVQ